MLWQQRTRREQRLLIGMGLLLAVGIIWYALWQPWLSQGSPLATNARQRAGNPALDAAANAQAPQLARQTPGPATARRRISAAIMREATRLELAIVRLQPQGARVNVTLPACTFQALMTWLDALARRGIFASSSGRQRSTDATRLGDGDDPVLERPHAP